MKMNGQKGFALLLIVFGLLILINKIGFGLGHLSSFIIPLAMVGFGYWGIKRGRTIIGYALLVLGIIILLGKLSGLIGLLVAIGLIAWGISSLKRQSAY